MDFPMELINYITFYRKTLHYVGKYKCESKYFNDELYKVKEYQEDYPKFNLYHDNIYYYLEEEKEDYYIYYKLDKHPICGYTIEHIKYLEILVKEFKKLQSIDMQCEICEKEFNYLTEGKGIKEVLKIINKCRCRECFNKVKTFTPSHKNLCGYRQIYGDEWTQDEVLTAKRKKRTLRKKKYNDYVEREDVIDREIEQRDLWVNSETYTPI